MTPKDYHGPLRRKSDVPGCETNFEREFCDFMARVDQRNIDHDIASAAREQVAEDHEERIQQLEHAVTVAKTIGIGGPTVLSLIWGAFKFGSHFKG